MRVAIVHDYLTQRGGAERVVLSLLHLFPDADLYTSVYDPDGTYPEFREYDVRTSWLQRFMKSGRDARRLLPLYPFAFGNLRLRGYDLVLSSSSGFAHGVRVEEGTHAVYCYNPPRWLYRSDDYLSAGSPAPRWALPALRPLFAWMRRWDRRAAARPDRYIAISEEVARRVTATYGRDADVITPPVNVRRIAEGPRHTTDGEPYVLVISRLLPYKRVDLVVQACQRLGLRLVIVGEGPSYEALNAIADNTTEFRGRVSDAELNGLLHGCIALVQAGTEDFGLAPLEANAAGRPVIAYAAGGALETVIDGKTGLLVYEPTVDAFVDALQREQRVDWFAQDLKAHAMSFGESRFHREMQQLVTANVRASVEADSEAHASIALVPISA